MFDQEQRYLWSQKEICFLTSKGWPGSGQSVISRASAPSEPHARPNFPGSSCPATFSIWVIPQISPQIQIIQFVLWKKKILTSFSLDWEREPWLLLSPRATRTILQSSFHFHRKWNYPCKARPYFFSTWIISTLLLYGFVSGKALLSFKQASKPWSYARWKLCPLTYWQGWSVDPLV